MRIDFLFYLPFYFYYLYYKSYRKGKGKEVDITYTKLKLPLCIAGYIRTQGKAHLLLSRDPSNFLLTASPLTYSARPHNMKFEPAAQIEKTASTSAITTTALGSAQEPLQEALAGVLQQLGGDDHTPGGTIRSLLGRVRRMSRFMSRDGRSSAPDEASQEPDERERGRDGQPQVTLVDDGGTLQSEAKLDTAEPQKCKKTKTYNTEDSQVVTDPSTNSALCCLYMGERTGSLVFSRIWSYVKYTAVLEAYLQRAAVGYRLDNLRALATERRHQ